MLLYQYFAKFQTGEISAILERNGSTFWKPKGTNTLNFPWKMAIFIITIESRFSYPICAGTNGQRTKRTWDSWVGISFTIPVGGPKTILTGVQNRKTTTLFRIKGGTFSLSCNIKYCPFLPPTSWAPSLSTCHESTPILQESHETEGGNPKGEQPNATAFTQV